jgi:hypothetical protein
MRRLTMSADDITAKAKSEVVLERVLAQSISATRLCVGWLWDNLVTSCIDVSDTIPGNEAAVRWLGMFLKLFVTCILFVAGWVYRRNRQGLDDPRSLRERGGHIAVEMHTPGKPKKKRVTIKATPVAISNPVHQLHSPLL